MAKGFKHGGSGGGASLNFKVVGNPQPEAPSENTIWLNTDVPIGAWYFAATQPENMAEGDVWFPVDTASPVEFNALKKNGIQVYPISAKQYVGDAWTTKVSEINQGGAWVKMWDGELFDNGNQYEYITGGWWQNEDLKWSSSSYPNTGTVEISDFIELDAGTKGAAATTKEKIALTEYNAIEVNVDTVKTGYAIIVHDNVSGSVHDDNDLASANLTGTGVQSLDISGIEGSHYITLMCYNGRSVKASKVRLVR